MKRILVGVDGSKESLQAALLAANLAHQTNRSIELAHVLPDAVPMPPEAFSTELAVWRKGIAEEGPSCFRKCATAWTAPTPSRGARWWSRRAPPRRWPSWRRSPTWTWWWSGIAAAAP
jgi:nucleotide-binding universal stress UspA family protein